MTQSPIDAQIRETLAFYGHEAALCDLPNPWGAQGARGLEVYGRHFPTVYRQAVGNFAQFHRRLPDANQMPLAADHLFFSKFFRYFPTAPNAASKLNAALFLDRARFGDRIYVPQRKFIASGPDLPDDLPQVSGWWLKLDLGNATQIRVTPERIRSSRESLHSLVKAWFKRPRYGWRWGEWWYSASAQRIFFEEDLTDRMPGDEYQFFMKAGRCEMIKKRRVLQTRELSAPTTVVAAFFDPSGNHVPGIGQTDTYDDLALSPHLDVMRQAACQIAEPFDHVRVDFILLHDVPALGELSYCTMNARVSYAPEALANMARNAVRLDIPNLS